ncbi:MAG: L-aspartate oxidase [Mangrovibacterium sp.]
MLEYTFDTIVVGSGLAGLTAAYHAAQHGKVALVTKSNLDVSNSYYAQGGIAAVYSSDDSPESHAHDTHVAGRGLCEQDAVDILVREGMLCIREVIDLGMQFDKNEAGEITLGLEGGHSKRRILHADGDATGKYLTLFMLDLVKKQESISSFEYMAVTQLLLQDKSCVGVRALCFQTAQNICIKSTSTILATGGLSRIFTRTTNPHTATGDGVALAFSAGARVEDLEFVQFHPSALALENQDAFLISEAVRGEGAWLLNEQGERFMTEIHPLAELAPRDVVAFSIYQQMRKTQSTHVYLSLRHLDAEKIRNRFTNIYQKLQEFGYDMTKDLLPVAPAAHYMVGGVKTDLNGETNISGLFACGELASTGVMGANRLASNSLLECLVFGKRAGNLAGSRQRKEIDVRGLELVTNHAENEDAFLTFKNELAEIMSSNVGIVRDAEQLKAACEQIERIKTEIKKTDLHDYNFIKAWQIADVCALIAKAALLREESRGGHIREDFRKEHPDWKKHIVFEKNKDVQYTPLRK